MPRYHITVPHSASFITFMILLLCLMPYFGAPTVMAMEDGNTDPDHTLPLSAELRACLALQEAMDERGYRSCLDKRVMLLRSSFFQGHEEPHALVLPQPPRQMGVHTPCLKFGRSCPMEYIAFLESRLSTLPIAEVGAETNTPHSFHRPPPATLTVGDDTGGNRDETVAMPIPFNASWSYGNWSTLVNLYSHVQVLQRRLQATMGEQRALRPGDTLTADRVRQWQRTLTSTSANRLSGNAHAKTSSSHPVRVAHLWRCTARYTASTRTLRAFVWLWQCASAWTAQNDPSAGGLGAAVRWCLVSLLRQFWPCWTWTWWLRRGVLGLQFWYLVDALAGEPLDASVEQDVHSALPPAQKTTSQPGKTTACGGGEGKTDDNTLPDAAASAAAGQTVEAHRMPVIARDENGERPRTPTAAATAEASMEQLVRYYSLVDLHLEQHLPLVFVKLRRVLCLCLLCQFALLMLNFVEQWSSWTQGFQLGMADTRTRTSGGGGFGQWVSPRRLSVAALRWASPWGASPQTSAIAPGRLSSVLIVVAPILVGVPTLVLAAKGFMEANKQLEELRSHVLRDQVAVLQPSS